MESKEKTTPKKMQNILYEHVLGLNSESPFRFMPNFSTPPTRFNKIFNPFEAHLNERLHLPVFSPSVFKNASSPKTDEKFKWTIDEISRLKPADIDPSSSVPYEDQDSVMELKVQEKINTFFSEVIVPSPLNQPAIVQPLISDVASPVNSERQTSDVAVQTSLSLPLTLPTHVEEVLKPYFQTDCECDRNQELYKKFFEFEEQSTPESAQTSPALSVSLSPIEMSPFQCKDHRAIRNSGVFGNTPPILRECELSPIHSTIDTVSRRSATRLDFSSHMSVDSIVLVPDSCSDNVPTNKSFTFDYTSIGTPPRQELSTTSNNWDLEYKHVSLANDSDMDVSNSNTPRSKIFCSQRKKLSDSFITKDFENDVRVERSVPCKRVLVNDDTDVGYQTGSIFLSEDSTCSNTAHLFASTPTKNKKQSKV